MSERFPLATIESLLLLMREQGAVALELEEGGARLSLRLAEGRPVAPVVQAAPAPVAAPASAAAPAAAAPGSIIKSPMVGTFYRSPRPDAPSFVEVGDRVRKGQVVCIIEAMKLFNEIESDVDGVVAEVLAETANPVQFGQGLFRVVPA